MTPDTTTIDLSTLDLTVTELGDITCNDCRASFDIEDIEAAIAHAEDADACRDWVGANAQGI